MKKWLLKLFLCYRFSPFPMHDWTCAAQEGIPATPKQLADGVAGFWDYATCYCKRCGVENRSSVEAKERARG
jgi:hypothetical protein